MKSKQYAPNGLHDEHSDATSKELLLLQAESKCICFVG